MALIVADRVMESSVSTGTGAFALDGAYSGYRDFDSVCSNGDTVYYSIEALDGNGNPSGDWEVGLGTFTDTDTLTRTTPAASSNAGAAVNFAAGTKRVMLSATAGYLAAFQTAIDTKAAKSQTAEQISGFIASPSDKSYTIAVKMAHAGTITETTTISASGTCTATFKINSTALGGTANSVSSSEQSQAHASNNAFSAGDDIVLTVSSNSSCADMSFSIKYSRTLA